VVHQEAVRDGVRRTGSGPLRHLLIGCDVPQRPSRVIHVSAAPP
jgi:hypothetical protein